MARKWEPSPEFMRYGEPTKYINMRLPRGLVSRLRDGAQKRYSGNVTKELLRILAERYNWRPKGQT